MVRRSFGFQFLSKVDLNSWTFWDFAHRDIFFNYLLTIRLGKEKIKFLSKKLILVISTQYSILTTFVRWTFSSWWIEKWKSAYNQKCWYRYHLRVIFALLLEKNLQRNSHQKISELVFKFFMKFKFLFGQFTYHKRIKIWSKLDTIYKVEILDFLVFEVSKNFNIC